MASDSEARARLALDEATRRRDARATLPTRVGIALVDHDDNVLESGPYFSVELELAHTGDREGLVTPMLVRYASRLGISSQRDSVPAASPQEASNKALRKTSYAVGDIVLLHGDDDDGELPRIAEVVTAIDDTADIITRQFDYLVLELDPQLEEQSAIKAYVIQRLATAKEVVKLYRHDEDTG